jgi:hypothetical protein
MQEGQQFAAPGCLHTLQASDQGAPGVQLANCAYVSLDAFRATMTSDARMRRAANLVRIRNLRKLDPQAG